MYYWQQGILHCKQQQCRIFAAQASVRHLHRQHRSLIKCLHASQACWCGLPEPQDELQLKQPDSFKQLISWKPIQASQLNTTARNGHECSHTHSIHFSEVIHNHLINREKEQLPLRKKKAPWGKHRVWRILFPTPNLPYSEAPRWTAVTNYNLAKHHWNYSVQHFVKMNTSSFCCVQNKSDEHSLIQSKAWFTAGFGGHSRLSIRTFQYGNNL